MNPRAQGTNILIAYHSRTGNTKAVAEIIRQKVGGTMAALELEKPYPADYRATVEQVVREDKSGYLPPLKAKIDRFEQYDLVFVGFPTWDMQLPPPIASFLRKHDLKGKTVAPFNTSAGYGEGTSFQTVRRLCPHSTVLEVFATRGGIERDGQLLVITGGAREAGGSRRGEMASQDQGALLIFDGGAAHRGPKRMARLRTVLLGSMK